MDINKKQLKAEALKSFGSSTDEVDLIRASSDNLDKAYARRKGSGF